MNSFERTPLWTRTLATRSKDQFAKERESLRASYLQFRTTVAPLANEIAMSMPMFTDHSIEHIDALWDMASIVCGDSYKLNPAEAFVLGGAFLLHDLGMGLVAYPGGLQELESDSAFGDYFVNARSRISYERNDATAEELDRIAREESVVTILRQRHAAQAERLINQQFALPGHAGTFYLLQDAFLRQAYGTLIGRLAHSHWFDVASLERQFGRIQGSLPGFPPEWCIDPLKIACILRASDAAHIDSRRAPTFLHAFRKPAGHSLMHWDFQQRLTRPRPIADRLEYTSSTPFSANEVGSWWLAYETIGMIDRELRQVDDLCADLGRDRLAVRSVAGAGNPERLSSYLPTENWVPIDASLRVSNVSQVVSNLGGSALYGRNVTVPLRELISNATDATRARRLTQGEENSTITVSLTREVDGWWLEVRDRGIGMSSTFLVNCLTDFGKSYWQSSELIEQNPNLLSQGFQSTGRYGIGFFAIFVIADFVQVRSLRYPDNPANTHVLEFREGLHNRPLLRVAETSEQIKIGGTVVRARLKHAPTDGDDGILRHDVNLWDPRPLQDVLKLVVQRMCALNDIDIEVSAEGSEPTLAISGGAWETMPAEELFDLLYRDSRTYRFGRSYERARSYFAEHASPIEDSSGRILGRTTLRPPRWNLENADDEVDFYDTQAHIFIGGLRSNAMQGLLGALKGTPLKADRSSAVPIATIEEFKTWAKKQVDTLEGELYENSDIHSGHVPRFFGLRAEHLPCGFTSEGVLSINDVQAWSARRDRIELLDLPYLHTYTSSDGNCRVVSPTDGQEVSLPDTVLLTDFDLDSWIPEGFEARTTELNEVFGKQSYNADFWWPENGALSTPRYILEAIARSWGVDVAVLLQESEDLMWIDENFGARLPQHERGVDARLPLFDKSGRRVAKAIGIRLKRSSRSAA